MKKEVLEHPVSEPIGGNAPEYLSGEELMTRLEPRIRALFR